MLSFWKLVPLAGYYMVYFLLIFSASLIGEVSFWVVFDFYGYYYYDDDTC